MPIAPGPGRVEAGASSREGLARILGLGPQGGGVALALAELDFVDGAYLRLRLRRGAVAFAVHIGRPDAPAAYLRRPGFSLTWEGPTVQNVTGRLLEAFAKRLDGRALGELLAMVCDDPGSRAEAPPAAEAPTPPTVGEASPPARLAPAPVPASPTPLHRDAQAWRRFMLPELGDAQWRCEISPMATIRHADMECHRILAAGDGATSLFNDTFAPCAPRSMGEGSILHADLREKDVLAGPNARLSSLLTSVKEAEGPAPRLVLVQGACLEEVIGDDMEMAIRRSLKGMRAHAFSLPVRLNGDRGVLHRLLRARKLTRQGGRRRKPLRAVDFYGFPRTPGFARLLGMLEELGIRANAVLAPAFDLKAIEGFGRAEVQIFQRGSPCLDLVEQEDLCPPAPRARRTLPGPYGVKGTRAWLRAIAGLFGQERSFDSLWRERMRRFETGWSALRGACSGRTLAFVVDERDANLLSGPRGLRGIPLLGMVREAGFGVRFLRYEGDPSGAEPSPLAFRDEAGLSALLRSVDAEAVFSDITLDGRILRAGKAQFSAKEADMGLEGAERLARSLLAACRTTFFADYRDWLDRDPS